MPTITITGDATQEALEQVLYRGIGKYGKDFNVKISKNLRFENQNTELKELRAKVDYMGEQLQKTEKELKELKDE